MEQKESDITYTWENVSTWEREYRVGGYTVLKNFKNVRDNFHRKDYRIIPLVPAGIRRDFRVFWRSGNYTGRE